MAKVNYTPEMVEQMTALYAELGNDGIDTIAQTVGRSVRSVRSKLVREGVYVAPEKPVKVEIDKGPSKKELLDELQNLAGVDTTGLAGATKEGISLMIEAFKALQLQDVEAVA